MRFAIAVIRDLIDDFTPLQPQSLPELALRAMDWHAMALKPF